MKLEFSIQTNANNCCNIAASQTQGCELYSFQVLSRHRNNLNSAESDFKPMLLNQYAHLLLN